ncbi:DUF559 domain-containing protein [Desulfobacterales bacterium HSG16]|nr:DUF559 domain-containing protein [Desulfobacterales bacterium HSG16]
MTAIGIEFQSAVLKNGRKTSGPPQWLGFYQTKIFGQEAFAINYYAQILDIKKVYRWQLFPSEKPNKKTQRRYYKIFIAPLQKLEKPIISLRRRRIHFIQTTWNKFINAVEINDLYNESPLEDRLWVEFKRLKINAERQKFVRIKNKKFYALDFAIYCVSGKIDVETDGKLWHTDPESSARDSLRDNDLKTDGWNVLRFNTDQLMENMDEYCIPAISEKIDKLDGIKKSEK